MKGLLASKQKANRSDDQIIEQLVKGIASDTELLPIHSIYLKSDGTPFHALASLRRTLIEEKVVYYLSVEDNTEKVPD